MGRWLGAASRRDGRGDAVADGKSYERAKTFRRALTPPEARLWVRLRRRSLSDLRFRRQHPVGPYILDFYCAAARLAVEVDGEVHGQADQAERDVRRDAWLAGRGVRVIRLRAEDVRVQLDDVLEFIVREATGRLTPASPPPSRR
jgi:very-short-patch-repair endonuclease